MRHTFKQNENMPQNVSSEMGGDDSVLYIIESGFAAISAKGHAFETAVKNQAVGLINLAGHRSAAFPQIPFIT